MEIKRIDPEKRLSFQELMQLYLYSAIRSGTGKLPEYRSWRLTEGLIRAFNQEERSVLQNRLDALLRQDPGPVAALRRTYEAQPWEVEKPVIWDDRSKSNYYISNLEDSHRFEVYAEWVFRQYGIDIGLFYGRQQQYEVGETRAGIEIKHDKKSQETGNYYFEYMERLTAQGSWVESGLLKKDNTRYYFYGVIGDYLILPKDRLMDYYRRIVLENDPPAGCRKAEGGIHPDIVRVGDDGKDISVAQVRALRADAYIRPNEGQRKVYIFPDCALLTEQDQNVLLKVVEEGPPYAAFLFCAENAAVVLQTLRSRCVELKLHPAAEGGGEEVQAAEALCRCLAARKRGKVTELAVRLEKKRITREDLSALLERSRALCAAALLLQYGQEPEESCREIAPILAKNLTKSQIMRTIELLQKYRGECTYNVGTGHVLGAIAVELEGIL